MSNLVKKWEIVLSQPFCRSLKYLGGLQSEMKIIDSLRSAEGCQSSVGRSYTFLPFSRPTRPMKKRY